MKYNGCLQIVTLNLCVNEVIKYKKKLYMKVQAKKAKIFNGTIAFRKCIEIFLAIE